MSAVSLANGGDQSKRRELDFYPTPPEVTHALMKFLFSENIINESFVVWEPACGNGAMSTVISEYVDDVISSDIRETGYGVANKDFLSNINHSDAIRSDAIITNPPFNLSEYFIRHARAQAGVVAMLLKSQYWHAQKRIELFNDHPPAYVLPLTWRPDFLFDQRANGVKGSPTMEVHWTVWVQGDEDTKYRLLRKD